MEWIGMEICKYCGRTMYLDERNTLDKKSYIESYNCGYCGAVYDKTIGQKSVILKEFWCNPNKKNYLTFINILKDFIDLSNCLSSAEKSEMKDKIGKINDFSEIIRIFRESKLSFDEKSFQIAKKYCLKVLEENDVYGKETKHILKGIVESNISLQDMVCRIITYICTHDVRR